MIQSDSEYSQGCPACGETDIDRSIESFEGVCDICGFVIREDSISRPPDWEITEGTFEDQNDRSLLDEFNIWNSTEQRLAHAFKTLDDMAAQLTLGLDIREKAADVYCDAFREGITDGRETTCIVAACIGLGSRQIGRPVPKSRLTKFSDVTDKSYHRSHTALLDELEIQSSRPAAIEFVSFLDSQVELAEDDRTDSERMLESIKGKQEFVGKDPAGIAAGCVYVHQEDLTQREVGEAVGISTETIRQRVKQFREEMDIA